VDSAPTSWSCASIRRWRRSSRVSAPRFAGDRAALERSFRVQFDGTLAHWTLLLVPVDASLAGAVQDVRIEGERDVIRTVQIRQSDGDTSLLTLGPEISHDPAGCRGPDLGLLVVIAVALVARATYTADLSAFLPRNRARPRPS